MVEGDSDKHMTQTPFEVSLPAGKYDLYVHALVSPLLIYMQTNAVPIEIKAGEQLQTSVTIPSGRLQASSTLDGKNIAGMKVDISGNAFATDPSGFKQFSTYGSLQTPIDGECAARKIPYQRCGIQRAGNLNPLMWKLKRVRRLTAMCLFASYALVI